MDTTALPDLTMKKYDKVIFAGMALLLLGVLGGAAYGIILLLPTLLLAAENGVLLLIMLIVGAALGFGLLDIVINFPNFLLHMKMSAQAIRRRVISGNPIAAIDVSINNLQNIFNEASKLSAEAAGATLEAEKAIRADDHKSGALDKAENEDKLAQVATAQGLTEVANDHLVKAERWHRTAETLQPLLDRQKARQARMEEARKQSRAKIDDLKDQRENVSIMLRAYQADAKQSKALASFFGKGSKDMANIEIAVDEIVKQGALAEAQIQQMLSDAEPEIQAQKLQDAADAAAARARLSAKATPKGISAGPVPLGSATKVRDGIVIEDTK